jgi:hypothetical protein
VRAENRIHGSDQQSCSPSGPIVMIAIICLRVVFFLITPVASWLLLPA